MSDNERRENGYVSKLEHMGIDEIPARKAAKILSYFAAEEVSPQNRCMTKRIGAIWAGMRHHEISPLFSEIQENFPEVPGMDEKDAMIYHELDSIQIGLDVCKSKGLVNVMNIDTKYSISSAGMDFL